MRGLEYDPDVYVDTFENHDFDSDFWRKPVDVGDQVANVQGETRGIPWRATLAAGQTYRVDSRGRRTPVDVGWTSVIGVQVGIHGEHRGDAKGDEVRRSWADSGGKFADGSSRPDVAPAWDAIGRDVSARLRDFESTRVVLRDLRRTAPAGSFPDTLAGITRHDRATARQVAVSIRQLCKAYGRRDHREIAASLMGVSIRTVSNLLRDADQRKTTNRRGTTTDGGTK